MGKVRSRRKKNKKSAKKPERVKQVQRIQQPVPTAPAECAGQPLDIFQITCCNEREHVRGALARFGVAADDLEDQTQEVMVLAWGRWSKLQSFAQGGADDRLAVRGWLITIASYKAAVYRRLRNRRRHYLIIPLDSPRRLESLDASGKPRDIHSESGERRLERLSGYLIDGASLPDLTEALDPHSGAITRRIRLDVIARYR